MKFVKVLFLGLLISILFCGSRAFAIDLYGFGSYWDKKDVDGSWGAGIGVSLPIIIDHLRLDGRAYYFEDSDAKRDVGSVQMIPLDLGLQVHILPSSAIDPYILGGISYIYVDDDTRWSNLDSKWGSYLGAGLDIDLGSSFIKLFGEAMYRFAKIDGNFDRDIDASGFTTNIGIKLHF